jgi:D-3-phosphoglycerate dehydrogenase
VAATLTGFLGRLLSQNVNPVNAQAVAKEHGYGIKHTTTQGTGPYVNLLSLQVKSTAGERLISGTVFGKGKVKVVRMDRAHIEFSLKGYLLLCRNDDKPGRLAGITSALAGNKVNIADCALGRDSDTGCAITALHLDTNLNESALQAVADVEGVQWCKFVNFND